MLADRYTLEDQLGRSATGIVWRSRDPVLQRIVAVTLVHPRLTDDPAFADALDEALRRVAALSVPGIARLLDTGEQDGVTYLVREYAPGSSLRWRVAEHGPMPPGEAVHVVVTILRALAEAHDRGVLHLGLRPDHVIVGERGEVTLIGFGVGAAIAASRPADAPELLGTDGLAPEMMDGTADARTDVFAAGAVLFELLTGRSPGGRTSPRGVRDDVTRALDRTVARALDPDPDRRHTSARAFADALEGCTEPDDATPSTRGRSSDLLAWIGVPILILGVALAVISLGLWLGELEVGGPFGIRAAPNEDEPVEILQPIVVRPAAITAIDPFGDGDELSSNASLANDGDIATAWRSEDYFDGALGKPGVGLLLDLGSREEILGLRIWTPHPGFRFHVAVGDDPDALVDGIGDEITSSSVTRVRLDDEGRYVLLWITSVVPVDDGIRAEVAEARVVVRSDDTGTDGA